MPAPVTDFDEAYYLLALCNTDGIGPATARKLLRKFGTAEEVFKLKPHDLMQASGMNPARASAIARFKGFDAVERELKWCADHGVRPVTVLDSAYPNRLRHCEDAPLVLFMRGNADLSAPRMVSVVGTRRVTDYGRRMAREITEHLAAYGAVVVSGMAYGVDIEAHKTALDCGVPTVGVLAHGLNRLYPSAHAEYAAEMVKNGALITEFTTDTKPDRENFPMRNRIVAGMVDAVIVIESGASGGSMITADLANGYSRDVFAVPGRIGDDRSEGCNKLIKSQRAHLVESVRDVGYIMGWDLPEKKPPAQQKIFTELSPAEEIITECLRESGPVQIDELCLKAGMPVSAVTVHLLNLELNGLVRSRPGKIFALS